MNKISWMLIIILLIFISLTFCERPDQIILQTNTNVEFQKIDPISGDPGSTDIPVYLNPGLTYGTVTDIEGNIYRTILIGSQTWMAENLRTTKFNDGSNIKNGLFGVDTKKSGSYWWYDNDRASHKNSYGALYNWYAVNTEKLCPSGWHVPSDDEWKQLEVHLGMNLKEADKWTDYIWFDDIFGRGTDQGDQLKATILWMDCSEGNNGNGINTTGFSAIPGGFRSVHGNGFGFFHDLGNYTGWWTTNKTTSSEVFFWDEADYATTRELLSGDTGIFRIYQDRRSGLSVRCLKD